MRLLVWQRPGRGGEPEQVRADVDDRGVIEITEETFAYLVTQAGFTPVETAETEETP